MITTFLLTQGLQQSRCQSFGNSVASLFSSNSFSTSSSAVAYKKASKSKRFLKRS